MHAYKHTNAQTHTGRHGLRWGSVVDRMVVGSQRTERFQNKSPLETHINKDTSSQMAVRNLATVCQLRELSTKAGFLPWRPCVQAFIVLYGRGGVAHESGYVQRDRGALRSAAEVRNRAADWFYKPCRVKGHHGTFAPGTFQSLEISSFGENLGLRFGFLTNRIEAISKLAPPSHTSPLPLCIMGVWGHDRTVWKLPRWLLVV